MIIYDIQAAESTAECAVSQMRIDLKMKHEKQFLTLYIPKLKPSLYLKCPASLVRF